MIERRAQWFVLAVLAWGGVARAAETETLRLPGLSRPVDVYFDGHGIPHLYAATWVDAARVTGYLHARHRLFQMDLLRRRGSGQLAEVLGPDMIEFDTQMRIAGIRRGCEELWALPDVPDEFRAELEAYAAGVNARLAELGEAGLPAAFQALGYQPRSWTPIDSLTFSKYMGLDQSGTLDDMWLTGLEGLFGPEQTAELWPLERPYEVPIVKTQTDRAKLTAARAPPLSISPRTLAAVERSWGPVLGGRRGANFGSNNWAIDGTKTASGKPILCNDPHLGFDLPSIWYTLHVSIAGRNVAGVTFPTGPSIVIGHNDRLGWGFTNMQADAMDFFNERVDSTDPLKYTHRGEVKTMRVTREDIQVKGEPARQIEIVSTVHGPLIVRGEDNVAIQWTGAGLTRDAIALWKLGRAQNLAEFLQALDELEVPAMNIVYADVDGHIGIHPCGKLPRRTHGRAQFVLDGASGEFDWREYLPRHELPLAIDPAEHFVASANGRPQPLGYPHYLGWAWDPSYRSRRINDLLSQARDVTLESMRDIQYDHYDKCAESFLPILLAAAKNDDGIDALGRTALVELEGWKYLCTPDAVAPTIWLEWFTAYRTAVWADEWASRGAPLVDGSWGFSGNNRREPMLEVLERMTREEPRSQWFDDRATPAVEDRDDIARAAFRTALAMLQMKYGAELKNWTWGRSNVLKIDSLTQNPALAREGGPVVGNEFTLNPGGKLGSVGSGASWRMMVDLAKPSGSVGIYPGGQSEDPMSPWYDDQMAIWARGQYLPLVAVGTAAELPADAKRQQWRLTP